MLFCGGLVAFEPILGESQCADDIETGGADLQQANVHVGAGAVTEGAGGTAEQHDDRVEAGAVKRACRSNP